MSETNHDINLNYKSNAKQALADQAKLGAQAKKMNQQQMKAAAGTVQSAKKLKQVTGGDQADRKALQAAQKRITLLERENRLLEKKNRLLKDQDKEQKKVAKNLSKTTFGGGFRQGMGWGGHNRPNWRARAGGAVAGGLRAGIGMAGMGLAALAMMPINAISSDYRSYFNYAKGMGRLSGFATGAPFGAGLRVPDAEKFSKDIGVRYGYSPSESLTGLNTFTRATGNWHDTEYGMRAARSTGLDINEIAGMFSTIRSGAGGFGEKGYKDFQRILAAAVKSGVDASTLPEYFEGVQGFISRAASGTTDAVSGGAYAALLGLFERSGLAGLKGARGAGILSSMESAYKSPKGAEAQAVIMGSLGYGRAGGNVGFYEAKKMMEQGFRNDPDRLRDLFQYSDRITGGEQESNLYLEGILGGTLEQIEGVRKALAGGDAGEIDAAIRDMTATELDRLTSIDHNTEFLHELVRAADIEMDDIERGKKYAKTLEAIEDLFRQFIDDMARPMVSALTSIEKVLSVGMPIITDFIKAMADAPDASPIEDTTRGIEMLNEAQELDNLSRVLLAEGGGHASVNDLVAGISALRNENELITEGLSTNPLAWYNEGGTAVANAVTEPLGVHFNSAADMWAAQQQNNLERALAALAEILRQREAATGVAGPSIANVHSFAEIAAVLSSIGLAIPAGPRSVVDSSGGSP